MATQNRTAQADGEMKNDTALKILISLSFPAALSQSIQQAGKGKKDKQALLKDQPRQSHGRISKNRQSSGKDREKMEAIKNLHFSICMVVFNVFRVA